METDDGVPVDETRGKRVACYADESAVSRRTVHLCAQLDPSVKALWDHHKQAAAGRMGFDDVTSELFVSMLLDVYAHHTETEDDSDTDTGDIDE